MRGNRRPHQAFRVHRPHARVRQAARVAATVLLCVVLSASLAKLALAASPMRGHPRPCTPPGHQYGVAGIQPAAPAPAHQYQCPPKRGR